MAASAAGVFILWSPTARAIAIWIPKYKFRHLYSGIYTPAPDSYSYSRSISLRPENRYDWTLPYSSTYVEMTLRVFSQSKHVHYFLSFPNSEEKSRLLYLVCMPFPFLLYEMRRNVKKSGKFKKNTSLLKFYKCIIFFVTLIDFLPLSKGSWHFW